jgi:hypothetical protein
MKVQIQLRKLLQDRGLDRRGIIQKISASTRLDRRVIAKYYNDEAPTVSLPVPGCGIAAPPLRATAVAGRSPVGLQPCRLLNPPESRAGMTRLPALSPLSRTGHLLKALRGRV